MDTSIHKYSGKKNKSFGIFLMISSTVIIFVTIGLPVLINKTIDHIGLIIASSILIPVLGLFLWAWLDTYYIIEEKVLKVKSGPFLWKVQVSEINMIRVNQKTIGGTIKPTLSWDSLEIKYKKYRSIFVTPDNQDNFISRLKLLNDKIELK